MVLLGQSAVMDFPHPQHSFFVFMGGGKSLLYIMGYIFPYVSVAVFLGGIAYKLHQWLTVPSPFPITVFPAPDASSGRQLVFLQEMLLFSSLYLHNRVLWLLSWLMHSSLGLIIAGHITGIYFLGEQFTVCGMSKGTSLALSHFLGMTTGVLFIICLLGLTIRRFYDVEARATSGLSNYIELGLLGSIALTGMGLRFATTAPDLVLIREYMSGLFFFHPASLPNSTWFLWHFSLFNLLVMYLPYSKLMHGLGGGIIRVMLTESPPVYPTAAGKLPRSSFTAAPAYDGHAEPPRSTI
jgi:nitrate reductase gamma subunit